MKTGIALYSMGHELVDEFADMGFEAVSVRVHEERFRNHMDALVRSVTARGLTVTIHGKVNPGNFDTLRELVDRLGDHVYSVLIDIPEEETVEGRQKPRLDDLLAFQAYFEDKNIYFGFEDLPLTRRAMDAHFSDAVTASPCFGVLLDVGHLNVIDRNVSDADCGDPGAAIRNVPVPIRELHVHDNAGDHDRHAPIGFGNIRFDEIARALAQIGFDGVSTLEISPRISGIDISECKRQARESLNIWNELMKKHAGEGRQ